MSTVGLNIDPFRKGGVRHSGARRDRHGRAGAFAISPIPKEVVHRAWTCVSEEACGRLVALPESLEAKVVLGYSATNSEVDPAGALAALRSSGATIVLPRIVGVGALTLHAVDQLEGLEHGPHGIRQPSMDAPQIAPDTVELVIVPGVAFDPHGTRVGYGGGHYDRLLASMPSATRVGVAFDEQVVGAIAHEPHDMHVHAVVTPTRVLRCSGTHDE